jgi:hypothetical protein
MLSKLGEKEERKDAFHEDAESGVVLLQQTNQLLVRAHVNCLSCS